MKKFYLFAALYMLLAIKADAQIKRYVKPGGSGDGSSWTNASANLQAIINISAANDEVWVATGTYLPTEKIDASGGVRDVSFILKAGVKIHGSLVDGATTLDGRNFITNASILSGNLGANGRAYHVVVSKGSSNNAMLDGFTIQDGLADVATELAGIARNQGAGINITNEATSITFKNLIIRGNQCSVNQGTTLVNGGGGVYLKLSGNSSNCTFENITFDANTAAASGGNMFFTSVSESPTVTVLNSKVFAGRGSGGAGFYTIGTDSNVPLLRVFNTIFSENRATQVAPSGGGVYLGGFTNTAIVNCSFYNNSGSNGGGIGYGNTASTVLKLYNSIFNSNTVSSSNLAAADIRNLTGITMDLRSNLFQQTPPEDSDPEYQNIVNSSPSSLFLSTAIANADFLKLVEGAATQKGNNQYTADFGLTLDLGGEERVKHGIVDLGAYEFQGTLPVELESFTAKKLNANVQLQWKVLSELNNDKFVIERGSDLGSLQRLTTIASKGDTQNAVTYSLIDYSPSAGNNYYRLSQVDKDGTTKVLGTEVVKFDLSNVEISVYPNPAKDFVKIKLNNERGSIHVRLISLLGQTVQSKRFNAANEVLLDIKNLVAGNYILQVESGKKIFAHKMLVVK